MCMMLSLLHAYSCHCTAHVQYQHVSKKFIIEIYLYVIVYRNNVHVALMVFDMSAE